MRNPRGIDHRISEISEDANRRIDRRDFLRTFVRRAAGVAAALSIADLAAIRQALATETEALCQCAYPGCGHCTTCLNKQCPRRGCPSGCTKCTRNDCAGCPYGDGSWVCCTNCCGSDGSGYLLCFDCKCPGCAQMCGCRSNCLH